PCGERGAEYRAIPDLPGGREDAAGEFAFVELQRRLQGQALGWRQHLLYVTCAGLADDSTARRGEFAWRAEQHQLAGGTQSEGKRQRLRQPRQLVTAESSERELRGDGVAHCGGAAGEQKAHAPGDQLRVKAGPETDGRTLCDQQRGQLQQR